MSGPPTRAFGSARRTAATAWSWSFEELLGRALPVADVRLVPGLPVPGRTSASPYRSMQCLTHCVDQLGPLRVVLRRVGPAREDVAVRESRPPLVLVRLGLRRESLGMKPIWTYGPHAALQVRVEDPVDDGPVVAGPPVRVFGVGVRAAPLEGRRAVPGVEQVVGPEVDRARPELAEGREQLPAVLHGGVVRLVAAEEAPDRRERAERRLQVDADRDREGVGRRLGRLRASRRGREQPGEESGGAVSCARTGRSRQRPALAIAAGRERVGLGSVDEAPRSPRPSGASCRRAGRSFPSRIVSLIAATRSKLASEAPSPRQARTHWSSSLDRARQRLRWRLERLHPRLRDQPGVPAVELGEDLPGVAHQQQPLLGHGLAVLVELARLRADAGRRRTSGARREAAPAAPGTPSG